MEMTAAIGIFTMGILTVVAIFQKGISQTRMLYEEEIALQVAESMMEHMRAKGLPKIEEEAEIPLPESLEAAKSLRNPSLSLSVRAFDPKKRGLKEIALTLSWQGLGRRKRQITLTTLIAELMQDEME